jgi:uncharacterized lipoprotein NlpE involved in copper resistance
MRGIIYIVIISFMFVTACENTSTSGETTVEVADTTSIENMSVDTINNAGMPVGATAKNSLDVIGKYKGVLPCADCEGIETTIELKADSTYSREMKYLGKKDNLFTATGTWTWASEFVINLGSIKEGPNRYFVAEGKLVQLDMSGKKISGSLADKYELKKQ